ncbi:unnamed protein product [Rhizophagus irregularis]|nr:unnamed protein product [Rhizophagus irregularis]
MEFCFDYNYCENNCFDSSNTSVRHSSDFRESGTDCDVETYEEVDTTSDNNVCVYDDLIEFEQSDSDNDIMEQGDGLELKAGMIFETWAKAESYLDDYAKQQGFCLCKKRRIPDPHDNNITRRRTFECSHANVHESEKVVLAENRRDRDSEMIGCTWHTNLAFPKKEKGVRINSVIGKHNHSMNPLVGEIAPKFRKLTEEMLEKIKFWTIYGKMGIPSQYNLLVASFPNKTINKKDLSNAIQKFKLQMTPPRNDACQVLNDLYLEKEKNPLWLVKPRFDTDERRLNSLFWMSPEQIRFYERYHDVVIIDSTSQTNQFDMILLLITVVDNNFRNLIVGAAKRFRQATLGAAIIEDETEATFSWILQELRDACSVTPIVLYSDADPALISAVRSNYQDTRHLLCIFHIDLNLRKKLKGKLRDNFESFRSEFLTIRNSLCHRQFEIKWNELLNKYPICQPYLTRVLYSCKTSWACYAINRNFTAGVQSSQHAEVSNKIIKEKLSRASHLSDVVKEVQAAFDNQSKRATITEFKNEIPTKGLPTILNEYFPNLDELLQDFLTPQILQKQRDQISQSLCYDVTLVTDWLPLLEVRDDFFQERLGREDEYDQPQSLFASLLENVPQSSIMEVWKVIRHRGQQLSSQYVILLDDGSHLSHARFHITLIPRRWHNDKKFNLNQDHASIPSYQIGKDESDISEQTPLQSISFSHLERIRKMPDIMQMQGPKQKYGFGMGYAKKALDYAVRADKVEEFVTQLKVFIEETKEDLSDQQDSVENMVIGDPLRTQHKGRQPNRYKSGGEVTKKSQKRKLQAMQDVTNTIEQGSSVQKRSRLCQKCKQPGHYAPRCPNL